MLPEESLARRLSDQLCAAGMPATASGDGRLSEVDVAAAGTRSLLIRCLWHEPRTGTFTARSSAGNERSRLGPVPPQGPAYLVYLREGSRRAAEGRALREEEVITCAQRWLAGDELSEVERVASFVNRSLRGVHALAECIAPRLRRDLQEDSAHQLWIYGDGRSCCLTADAGPRTTACRFLLGPAQVAFAQLEDPQLAVTMWLEARRGIRELASSAPGLALESHAEVLEHDPARWHWLHVRDRLADPSDVLAQSRALIEGLAASQVASRFFSFSSLMRFCFSASSHFPWVNEGLPVVAQRADGRCFLSRGVVNEEPATECDVSEALARIEAVLAAYPVEPFFGTAPDHELPQLLDRLSLSGSALQPRVVQRGRWFDLVVDAGDEARRCRVSGRHVVFEEGERRFQKEWPTLEGATAAIRLFLEDAVPLAQIDQAPPPRAPRA